MLQAYFDDAGTHRDARIICWGGFLGTDEQWAGFDEKWRAKLARPFDQAEHARAGLKRFHLAECQALDGEFRDYRRAECDSLQHDFREIICEAGVVGVAYCLERPIYERLVQGEAREVLGTAEQRCFASCFEGAFRKAQQYFPQQHRMTLIFDFIEDPVRQAEIRAVAKKVEQDPGSRPFIETAGFGTMLDNTPLQAADIMATENYWDAQAFLADEARVPRAHFQHFLSRVNCEGFIMREQEIRHYMWKHGFGAAAARG